MLLLSVYTMQGMVLVILLLNGIDTQSTLNWLAFSSHFKTAKIFLNGNNLFLSCILLSYHITQKINNDCDICF